MIEFEHVKMIRKRAETELEHCTECGAISDFVPLKIAADLFEIGEKALNEFVKANRIHITAEDGGSVCVTSLLEKMQTLQRLRQNGQPIFLTD